MITHPFSSPLQILAANASAAHLAVKPTNIETQKLIFPVELMNAVRAETAARLRQPRSEQKWHTITLRLNIKIIKFPKIVPTFLPQKCHWCCHYFWANLSQHSMSSAWVFNRAVSCFCSIWRPRAWRDGWPKIQGLINRYMCATFTRRCCGGCHRYWNEAGLLAQLLKDLFGDILLDLLRLFNGDIHTWHIPASSDPHMFPKFRSKGERHTAITLHTNNKNLIV